MRGTLLPTDTPWESTLPVGSYWKRGGVWFAITPNGHLANLTNHRVTQHDDQTITVHPSIRVSTTHPRYGSIELFHGFLERGVWRTH